MKRHPSAAIVAVAGAAAAFLLMLDGALRSSAERVPVATLAPVAALPELAGRPLDDLQRRSLHALLVPLLDSDEPATWARHTDVMPCLGAGAVSVDGAAIAEGAALPLHRPLCVRWQLVDCWPLGPYWMGLTGTLEMTVLVGTTGSRPGSGRSASRSRRTASATR